MDELIDIVDENDKVIGQAMKSEAHAKGLLHRAAHAWIYNSKGQILLQLRKKTKMVFPSVWDVSAAGHVGAGEDVIESMKREAEEEIGLKTDNIEFIKTKRFDNITSEFSNKEIVHIHLIKCDWDIDKFVIQEEELDDLKWFDVDFIIKDLDEHPEKYTPNHDYWKEVLNKIKELV